MKKNKSKFDLIIAIVITIIFVIILISIDAFEQFAEYSENHEEYELDELVLILLVGAFTALWYSFRRYKEINELKVVIENLNKNLNKDNLKKDKLLLEQSKMALMGEMLENIAHQWRQPLSIISTAASGIKVKKEFGHLEDNDLDKTLDNIIVNTKYLSNTIENFRSFINNSKAVSVFKLDKIISDTLNILKGNLTNSNIKVVLDLNSDIKVESYPNELIQALINIINNSKDALELNNIDKRFLFISSIKIDDKIQIKVKDNGKGIKESIILNVFEPYFTTKHNFSGTGLGLYMTYKIVNERLKGSITVSNTTFKYQDEEYIGAEFTIELPLSKCYLI